ncbi:AraC-like DNA-binding protein [Dyadobacter sp. BE34]|uniref:AraC-like DNA-binding protein n=1 Tax=Dyadobacter fermentans TaxID=94254 RepID=A0ABU1QW55_9BACT|nr:MULTISPECIES: AraC family transcriptional regulator [Dyadobacter]MDR6805328.1 AraC-like DNA-binding protein [Dyadobacter fermentans]MDR7042912.1 AraC-like DNA-binding protein [Dyadobacter sp. BE242]MDR7197224.1 AraC-like DNA-binding protein [Dyadobacter sp. BE34]MDR7215341.1 AraC-like DNA-binding protein [Dyadobacter sp. BE31]MDR7262877.1 AraC-like DNA-binding protein [Dyadobacter sp. BE32]
MKAQFEAFQPLPDSSFRIFGYEVAEFDAPWHYHPEYELTVILKSEGIRYVGNSMESFEAGDLVLLGPNLPHCWKNTPDNVGTASSIVVQWPGEFMGAGWLDVEEFKSVKRLLQMAGQGIRFDHGVSARVKPMLAEMLEMQPFPRLIKFLEVLELLAAVKNIHFLCEQGFAYPLNYEDNQRINTVYNYIREHYSERITLATLSGLVYMSEESFSRFFSRTMQKPLFTFLNEYRINMASKMLIETDMQVAEISFACGYESPPFFFRQFRKFGGMTPAAYRKQFRSTEAEG